MLAHAEPQTPREWDRAIAQEAQLLTPRSRHAFVLCGAPKPEMRGNISARFFERSVEELRQRYRYVILDIGADLLAADVEPHRTALALAQQVLLVASADFVGLWRARTTLSVMQMHLQLNPERVALIINRHDRRHGHSRTEIEWALNLPVGALVPYDQGGLQRALRDQRPLVLDGRSRAARALLDLAERVHGGSIELPADASRSGGTSWLGRLSRGPWRRPGVAKTSDGV
jgi:Flp pilus assembly CpaE family ATPase